MPAPKSSPRRKASGRNIPESERGTQQLKLRMPRPLVEQLRAHVATQELTLSEYVVRLVRTDLSIL